MTRERSDSKGRQQRRGGASASQSRGARPAARSGSAGKRKTSGAGTRAASQGRKRAARKAAPPAKPAAPRKPAARTVSSRGRKSGARQVKPVATPVVKTSATPALKPAAKPVVKPAAERTTAAAVAKPAAERTTPARAARPRTPTASLAKTIGARAAALKETVKSAVKAVAGVAAAARAKTAPRREKAPARPIITKGPADVTDEERVETAKYITGEQPPPRVFEEERFIFPETYGRTRVRLLVKDPHWLFAHWDVDPAVFAGLRGEVGERAAALTRLTLRVIDPEHGGGAVIHLPEDARSWYVRADRVRRAYRAELGITMPSGEYRALASSGVVRPPHGSAAPRRAVRRARYAGPRRTHVAAPGWAEGEAEWLEAEERHGAPGRGKTGRASGPGPWEPTLVEPRPGGTAGAAGGAGSAPDGVPEKGGASDVHRPQPSGASDLYRR